MKVIRIGICLLVGFTVFAHGAVEAWSEAVLEIGAAVLLAIWGVSAFTGRITDWHWNPLGWPLLGLWCLAMLQYVSRLTAYPYLTKIEVLKLGAYLVLFFLTIQAFRTTAQWKAFVWFLLVLSFCVSLFGIIQHFTFNGKLYWVRELRFGGAPFGPYVNRNHFAGLMELLIPSGLAILLLRAVRRDQLPLVALFTIVPAGALFLSASRGGITSFLLQLALLLILVWLRKRGSKTLAAASIVFLLMAAMVAWLGGVGRALERFSGFRSLEISEARRLAMTKDSWRVFLDHPWMGTGLGTLIAVYPRYESVYDGKVVNHAHNDYVELLAETGLLGGLTFALFLGLLTWQGIVRLRASDTVFDLAIRIGGLAACAGLLVHSFVDYNLHIPSNALLFLLQAGAASSEIRQK